MKYHTPFLKKRCSRCRKIKKLSEFHKDRRYTKSGYRSQCKECIKEYHKKYKSNPENKEKLSLSGRKYFLKIRPKLKRVRKKLRLKVLRAYGNKCQCCGEDTYEFLAIDHKNNDGSEHRKTVKNLYEWLVENNYPEGFQVLCHNCNMAKAFYGKCPHKN